MSSYMSTDMSFSTHTHSHSPTPTSLLVVSPPVLSLFQHITLSSFKNKVFESVYLATGCIYFLLALAVMLRGLHCKSMIIWPFVIFGFTNTIYYLALGVSDLANSAEGISSGWPLYLPAVASVFCFAGI